MKERDAMETITDKIIVCECACGCSKKIATTFEHIRYQNNWYYNIECLMNHIGAKFDEVTMEGEKI